MDPDLVIWRDSEFIHKKKIQQCLPDQNSVIAGGSDEVYIDSQSHALIAISPFVHLHLVLNSKYYPLSSRYTDN